MIKLFKSLGLIALFLTSYLGDKSAFGFEIPDTVVKVESRDRASQSLLKGSGVLFRHQDSVFVVTSDHVVFSATTPRFAHRAGQPNWNSAMQLLASDFSMGLALLKLTPNAATQQILSELNLPHLSDFAALDTTTRLSRANGAQTAGYPWRSEQLSWDQSGEILNPASDRMVLPGVDQMIELVHAHGEFGMSGGGVFLQDSQKVIGILSHQSIEMAPGTSGRVSQARQGLAQNHVFAVPAHSARTWILASLAGRVPQLTRSALNPQAVLCQGLEFSIQTEAQGAQGAHSIGGTDAIGIGGTDPVGIGGTDPVGIGGTDAIGIGGSVPPADAITLRVRTIANPTHTMPTQLMTINAGWIDQLKAHLTLQGPEASVLLSQLALIGTSEAPQSPWVLHSVYATSMTEFFSWIVRRSALPILPFAHTLDPALNTALEGVNQRCNQAPASILSQIQALKQVIEGSSAQAVSLSAFRQLISNPGLQGAWNGYFNEHFDQAVGCTEALDRAASAL